MADEQDKIFITPQEGMKILGVSRYVMYDDLLKRDDFPKMVVGKKYYINKNKLQEWADKVCGIK